LIFPASKASVEHHELVTKPRQAVIETKVQDYPILRFDEISGTRGFEDPVLWIWERIKRRYPLRDVPADYGISGSLMVASARPGVNEDPSGR
jgi:hypothetical protein